MTETLEIIEKRVGQTISDLKSNGVTLGIKQGQLYARWGNCPIETRKELSGMVKKYQRYVIAEWFKGDDSINPKPRFKMKRKELIRNVKSIESKLEKTPTKIDETWGEYSLWTLLYKLETRLLFNDKGDNPYAH